MLKAYTTSEFCKELLTRKTLLIIGAGRNLKKFEDRFGESIPQDTSVYVVDNSTEKQGKTVVFSNRELTINDWSLVECLAGQNTLALITVLRPDELIQAVLNNEATKNMDVVCFVDIIAMDYESCAMQKELPDDMAYSPDELIPRKIHYCWLGGKPLPDKNKYLIDGWHKMCPDYEIVCWNETNYDFTQNEYMRQAFESKIWGFAPDYARLDIVYKHGGIYLDTDVEIIKPFDDLLHNEAFAGFEYNTSVNFGQGFGAMKNHPMIRELRDFYINKQFMNEDGTPDMTGSPVFQTQVLQQHGLELNGEYQIIDGMAIYPEKMFCAKNIHTMCIQKKSYTHSIHHFDGTWATEESHKVNDEIKNRMSRFIKEC